MHWVVPLIDMHAVRTESAREVSAHANGGIGGPNESMQRTSWAFLEPSPARCL